jgi:hypothetical protein
MGWLSSDGRCCGECLRHHTLGRQHARAPCWHRIRTMKRFVAGRPSRGCRQSIHRWTIKIVIAADGWHLERSNKLASDALVEITEGGSPPGRRLPRLPGENITFSIGEGEPAGKRAFFIAIPGSARKGRTCSLEASYKHLVRSRCGKTPEGGCLQ